MKKADRLGLRTWIEIDKKAIAHNYAIFRSLISKETKLMGVVKSNAYGHNLTEFAKELEKLGTDYLAVDSVVEGLALRREGIKLPILVLGFTLPEMIALADKANMEITISNFSYFAEIKKLKLKKPIKVHIKVDTGMHRHGFQLAEMTKLIETLKKDKNVEVVGLSTHFGAATDPNRPKETKDQIKTFNLWREAFKKAGINVLAHACNTGGTILYPEAHFDMVRVGIGMYGIWPAPETKAWAESKFKLQPVLSWRTLVGEVKNIKAGEKLGYDFTGKVTKDSVVAILPIGYWHVFPRALSNTGSVLIRGQKAKVLGRVCMDIVTVDVTDIPGVVVGDVATIIGQDGSQEIAVDDIAALVPGSCGYETVTRINPLIRRFYQ
jgi:alanine racemase